MKNVTRLAKSKKKVRKGDAVIHVEPSTALITQKNRSSIEHQQETLRSMVSAITITNEKECQTARTLLTRIITTKRKAQAFINPVLQNAKEGLRLAKEQEAALVGPFREMEEDARGIINAYLTEVMQKEREQREEQERLKQEYEEKVAKSKRPERVKEPEPLPEDEIVSVPVMENTSVPMVPKYEITDEALIPEVYFRRVLNRELIWETVRAAHKAGSVTFDELSIPGVRIWEEASLTVRR